jgi:oxaloacetate decarboxylase (Na+ extruding) subunit alpha
VTDQIIQYALGYWGREGAELMEPAVKAKILDRPRAREWAERQPPEPTVHELRKKMNAESVSDEEFLLRWNLNVDEIETMRAAGAPKEYITARQPLVNLIDALSKRNDYRQIVIQKGATVISLQKSASA